MDSGDFHNRSFHDHNHGEEYIPEREREIVSFQKWLLILFILGIPVINFLVMLFLSFVSENRNLRNFGRAGLVISIISFFLLILIDL